MAEKAPSPRKILIFQSYLILATTIFIILAILAHIIPYFSFDLNISQAFQNLNLPGLLPLLKFISFLGYNPQMPILTCVIVLFLLALKLRWAAFMAITNVIGAYFLTGILKDLVARSRPTPDLVNVAISSTDKSFPSGHVLIYTAFFGFLWFLSFTLPKPTLVKKLLLIIFGGLIILVGPSRIYLGQHWPSDVIGAYLLGSIWLLITIYLYRLFLEVKV